LPTSQLFKHKNFYVPLPFQDLGPFTKGLFLLTVELLSEGFIIVLGPPPRYARRRYVSQLASLLGPAPLSAAWSGLTATAAHR